MIAWKPCVDSSDQAMRKPRDVSAKASAEEDHAPPSRARRPSTGRPSERDEDEERPSLQEAEERPAERPSRRRSANGRSRGDEDALQESLAPVLDDGDRGEDRREEDDEDDGAGEEVGERRRRAGRARARGAERAARSPSRRGATSGSAARRRRRRGSAAARTGRARASRARAPALTRPPAGLASSSRKRRPVASMKTSSSDGAPSVSERKRPGKGLDEPGDERRAPRARSRRTAPPTAETWPASGAEARRRSRPRGRGAPPASSRVSRVMTSPPTFAFRAAGAPRRRAGPRSRIPIRCAASASSKRCVVRRTRRPAPSRGPQRRALRSRRAPGSRPVEGSSRRRTGGRWRSALAISTRRARPPESVSTRSPARSRIEKRPSSASMRAASAAPPSP